MKNKGRRERVRRERKRKKYCFFLRSMEIESSVFFGVRRKVDPRIASYALVSKSWSFVKLHEVGNFFIWNISSLKII